MEAESGFPPRLSFFFVARTTLLEEIEPLRVDPAIEVAQTDRLTRLCDERDRPAVRAAPVDPGKAAAGSGNVLPLMKEALRLRATVGEVCHTLRGVWGLHRPVERF